jgi:calpain-15
LSSLSAIAEYPNRISKLFLNKEANQYGAYSVVIYINGVPTEVVVDDYFPCVDGVPMSAKPVGNELWVLILEKAWMKICGSYENAEV